MQTCPLLRKLSDDRGLCRRLDVDVRKDDHWSVPSELETQALYVVGRLAEQILTHLGRSGERDLPAEATRHKLLHDLPRRAHDEVDDSGGQVDLVHDLEETEKAERRLTGGTRNRCAADREGGSQLAGLQHERKVPGRDRCAHTHGMSCGEDSFVREARRNHASISALSFLGEPLEGRRGAHHLRLGLDERLPLLHRHRGGKVVGALPHEVGDLFEFAGAVVRRELSPGGQCSVSCLQCPARIHLRSVRDCGDRFLGGRVGHVEAAAFRSVDPFVVDIELSVSHLQGGRG